MVEGKSVRRFVPGLLLVLIACLIPASVQAATVSVSGATLNVVAAPGEQNSIFVGSEFDNAGAPVLAVTDGGGTTPAAGPGCVADLHAPRVTCPALGVERAVIDAGDRNDAVAVSGPLRARILGGAGNDQLHGGDGRDTIDSGTGRDRADGGSGADSIILRDRRVDGAFCGPGRDRVRAEVLDSLDFTCESVDYGPTGRVGKLRAVTGHGRFVKIPGQGGARIDRRILPAVMFLIRKYKVHVGDGYAYGGPHSPSGEHPLGLAVDLYPGPGGSWNKVDKLARWAEPRQNHTRWPFRWVGYDGDYNHGRGNHLHLSWQHTPGRRGHPVRTVWTFAVK
jgi:hemolysin type calcium-binding protein